MQLFCCKFSNSRSNGYNVTANYNLHARLILLTEILTIWSGGRLTAWLMCDAISCMVNKLSSVSRNNRSSGMIFKDCSLKCSPMDRFIPSDNRAAAIVGRNLKPWNIHSCRGFMLRCISNIFACVRTQCIMRGFCNCSLSSICFSKILICVSMSAPCSASRPHSPIATM